MVRRPKLGHRERDLLDTLRAGPRSTAELQAELGAANRAPLSRALRKLRELDMVRSVPMGRGAHPGRWFGLQWEITALGEVELLIRERAGYRAGVPGGTLGRLSTPTRRRTRA